MGSTAGRAADGRSGGLKAAAGRHAPPPGARSLASRTFHRILLVKPSSLGDLVHALPVLHGLRQRYPEARIDWLAATVFAPLIEGHPDLSEVIRFDRRRFGRMSRSPRSAWEFFAGLRAGPRRRRYDLLVDLQGLFRSGLMALATGADVRIGFGDARELGWMFYTHRIPAANYQTHAVDRNYMVSRMLGFESVPLSFDLAVTGDQRRRAADILRDAGLEPETPFVAVMPGARWETKRWPEQRFAKVIDRLAEQRGLPAVLLAGPDEVALCDRVEAYCRPSGGDGATPGGRCRLVNLAGRTGLGELVGVLERAAAVICHDSAPMHLAAALGRPLVCILGPTNPLRTGPYTPAARILQADWPCVPCYLRRLSQCRHEHVCMSSIRPEQVLEAVTVVLARGGR